MDYFNRRAKALNKQKSGVPVAGAPIFENNPINFGW